MQNVGNKKQPSEGNVKKAVSLVNEIAQPSENKWKQVNKGAEDGNAAMRKECRRAPVK